MNSPFRVAVINDRSVRTLAGACEVASQEFA